MRIIVGVAPRAIKLGFKSRHSWVRCDPHAQPIAQHLVREQVVTSSWGSLQSPRAELGESRMIHEGQLGPLPPMFAVALFARIDARVKRRRLTLQQGFAVCVA